MTEITISSERIISKIYIIRNKKVMLDRDIAGLYGVKTFVLNQAVKRNLKRFPADFMFQLNKQEMENWKSQFVISNSDQNSLRSQSVILKGTNLKSQIVTSNSDKDSLRFQTGTLKGRGKHSKYLPYAFPFLPLACPVVKYSSTTGVPKGEARRGIPRLSLPTPLLPLKNQKTPCGVKWKFQHNTET